jgi:hypothetical protein
MDGTVHDVASRMLSLSTTEKSIFGPRFGESGAQSICTGPKPNAGNFVSRLPAPLALLAAFDLAEFCCTFCVRRKVSSVGENKKGKYKFPQKVLPVWEE